MKYIILFLVFFLIGCGKDIIIKEDIYNNSKFFFDDRRYKVKVHTVSNTKTSEISLYYYKLRQRGWVYSGKINLEYYQYILNQEADK